jgi:hypothetical protein
MGLQATGMFGYRLAANSVGASVAVLRRTFARARPVM